MLCRHGTRRHLLQAAHHRLLRTRSFLVWTNVTATC